MLLSAVLYTYSLRYMVPTAVMLGSAPTYLLAWGCWRALSTVLPERIYRSGDDRLYTLYQSMVLFFFQHYTGVEIIIYGDLPTKENILYISNHQCTVDWIVADMLAVQQNALGHVRYVLKDGLKFLPLYGFYFSQMYLVIFPEGTRYNPSIPKVIADSQAFAKKEGLPVLKHVLTPRVKATHVAIDVMQDYLDAVYDITVAYERTIGKGGQRKEAPSMIEFLCKECPRIHIFLERISVKDIPKEHIFMKRWLHERFEVKDKVLTEFYESTDPDKTNTFPGVAHNAKLELRRTVPSLLILTGVTAGMLCTETGRKVYLNTWIYGTLIGILWVSIKA
ncbi:1-acyl-sn-glycerol-3-phosphate acyltransferase epsilon isoform X2 [Xenopus laevis]|uniref:1-acyl-sn-glycerol-3-phosphate acyltransferase epsilon isoform X2 n=1 Tax=Xenopus laevis TaxID=8355 RepID=A0A8J0VGV0_XENLA|nr:1-acyl-sn-glycerol-3-phosphate acyltransferase epsilon isoform X2 [Xenopus laevis]